MAYEFKCGGCPHWKWHKKDTLYDAPGYHKCDEPDFCERYGKKKIQRGEDGFITDACLADMHESLPIELFVMCDRKPHRAINTAEELENYLFGALPYVLSTYYRSKVVHFNP